MPDATFGTTIVSLPLPADRQLRPDAAFAPAEPADPATLRAALAAPVRFPPLRRALTPGDRVAVVVDPEIDGLLPLLDALLDDLAAAKVERGDVTLVLPADADVPPLPAGPQVFVHDPADEKAHAYLAATAKGQRIELPRPIVDADQVVVVAGTRWRPDGSASTAADWLHPRFAPADVRREALRKRYAEGLRYRPAKAATADEIGWLLGLPFAVQVLPDGAVIAGRFDTHAEAEAALRERWGGALADAADLVVATVAGDATAARLARAAAHAAAAVRPGGAVAVLSAGSPPLGPAFAAIRGHDEPGEAWAAVRAAEPADLPAAFDWLTAARQARLYLLGGWDADVTEELFATALERAEQVARLLPADGRWLLLADADQRRMTAE